MMIQIRSVASSIGLTAVASLFAVTTACGGAKPPAAQSVASASPPSSTTPADAPPTATTPPTATQVAISDEIRSRCGISDADAYFPFDSARVTSNDHTPLDLVAKCFTNGPLAGRAVKLVGRADARGSSDYNLTLGQSRADAVGTYLDVRGMSKSKTQSTSRGAMDASGADEGGWQHDRRVDVMLGD
jgi:outer membrane protein OmpA-like peptidoglycan-associated protein